MPEEAFEVDQHITAHSRYYAGRMGSRFYTVLRDEQRILGVRCKVCDRVLWPPRTTCFRCFSSLSEADLAEIGPEGTLVHYQEPVHPPWKGRLVYGIIRLDGADSGMAHLLGEMDFDQLKPGLRVAPVFAPQRSGNILDIAYFRPAES
jgi:hypothetical protein